MRPLARILICLALILFKIELVKEFLDQYFKLSKLVKLPAAFPLEGMHAICLGIFKQYNYFFFSTFYKDEAFYLGIIYLLN